MESGAGDGSRGVAYFSASDPGSVDRILASRRSVVAAMPGMATAVCTDTPSAFEDFDHVIALDDAGDLLEARIRWMTGCPFEQAVHLAPTTYVSGDLAGLFGLLEKFDLAVAQSLQRITDPSGVVPDSFFSPDTGVMAVRRSGTLDRFVGGWRSRLATVDPGCLPRSGMAAPGLFDTTLRAALFEDSELRFILLGPEYGCWFEEPGVLAVPPVILRAATTEERFEAAARALERNVRPTTPGVHIASSLLVPRRGALEIVATLGVAPPPRRVPPLPSRAQPERAQPERAPSGGGIASDDLLVHVLGMHRSGTSAVAGTLALFDLVLIGQADFMRPDHINPRGYFESQTIRAVNDRVLEALGGTWSAPPSLPEGWQEAPGLVAMTAQLRKIVENVTPEPGPASWKDPRLCLTLPLWRNALERVHAGVFVYRNPVEVAHSLYRSQRVAHSQGMALWERYTCAALKNAAGMPLLVVRYDDLLADPDGWSGSVAGFLAVLGVRGTSDSHAEEVSDFLGSSLRRERPVDVPQADLTVLPGQQDLLEFLDASRGFHPDWPCPEPLLEGEWVDGMLRWAT